jgi:cysteine desulfurase
MAAQIYLDHQSTTPVDPRVLEKMLPYFTEVFGNAASKDHMYGLDAKRAVEEARRQIAALIGAEEDEIIFTSGATEANNLALFGVMESLSSKGNHLITAKTEHKAILDAAKELERRGKEVTYLDVDEYGRVDVETLRSAIKPSTVLVSIMAANNEIGTLAPLEEIGKVCANARVLFHSDAVQLAGHLPLDVKRAGIHLASLSAHKMYGPKGVGALYRQKSNPRVEIHPVMFGGGHERGIRSGTLNVPAIIGFGEAARIAKMEMAANAKRFSAWTEQILSSLQNGLQCVKLNGHPQERLPHNLNVRLAGVNSRALIVDLKDVAIATGSACTSESVEPSHVLMAIGMTAKEAHQSIRISVGRANDDNSIEVAIGKLIEAASNTLF